MTHDLPYTLTIRAVDSLTKIAETVTRLEYGTGFKRNIKLHRENRVRSIYSSLAIEGNTLSLGEVTDVIEGRLVAGKQAEVKEVKNAYQAYDTIMTFSPYSIEDFLRAHTLMTGGLVEESGRFRSGDVGVFDGGTVIHVGARPMFVPQLMRELFEWARTTDVHPALVSAIVHSEIETIHPFADGNGRMGRLWQTLILAKWNEVFAWIPMESLVYEKRPQYYDALRQAQRTNDSGGFIEFTLSAILEAVEAQAQSMGESTFDAVPSGSEFVDKTNEFVENGDKFVDKFVENDTQREIVRLLIADPSISAKRMAEEMGMSARGVQKSIAALRKQGLVERVGSAKGGHWVVKRP
ncbi:MAG: Fic family protein [Propionibacteriaceae bacterium]|jgi:Fic family protein|nr:Fic family protein [Propionibacteriaceae bacterium]